jgi:GCN5-related N-acetyltransferase
VTTDIEEEESSRRMNNAAPISGQNEPPREALRSDWDLDSVYRNQHVASELIGHALDEIRGTGKKFTIICPVVGEFIAHNPRYLDLIDEVHHGAGAEAARNGR